MSDSPYGTIIEQSMRTVYPQLTPRHPKLLLREGLVDILTGMRRAGKTFCMFEVLKDLTAKKYDRQQVLYVNLEEHPLPSNHFGELIALLEAYYSAVPFAREQGAVLAFDEIQIVDGWERFVRRVLDMEKIQIILTGSSAKMLSQNIATQMRGRAYVHEILPMSFEEVYRLRHKDLPMGLSRLEKLNRSRLSNELRHYLTHGGFPDVQSLSPQVQHEMLRVYVDSVLLRDVIENYAISNNSVLVYMAKHILQNPASNFSVHKFAKDVKSLGFRVSSNDLYSMFANLCDSFLVHAVSIDSNSLRRQMVNARKIYPNDTGLAVAFMRQRSEATGALLETFVYLHLRRYKYEINYVRTHSGYEVDFLARPYSGPPMLIQVCAWLGKPETREREFRALLEASKEYPDAELTVVTMDEHEDVDYFGKRIRLVPAWLWALSRHDEFVGASESAS